ncbi:MAG: hypothetical protein ATN34_03730, partial [Epulopiscium sp. Nele67-Bin002]
MIAIKNDKFSVKIDELGAQLISIRLANGNEVLWQGDKKFWTGQAPVLFPIVGTVRDNKVIIDGQWYEMPRHGLARHKMFKATDITENSVRFELKADKETKKSYPFNFSLQIIYNIEDTTLYTTYIITNLDEKSMPFAIGAHPAFNVPFEEDYMFEDYIIEFEEKETLKSPLLDSQTGLLDFTQSKMEIYNEDVIPLSRDIFAGDAIVYEGFNKNVVRLKNPKTSANIEMRFDDFPLLGIWNPKGEAPFVCLEPWVGCATTTQEGDDIIDKKHIQIIDPLEQKSYIF